MNRYLACLFLTLFINWLPQPAQAHKIKVFASHEGEQITGYGYYPGGGKYQHGTVEIFDQTGQPLTSVTTDQEGRFRFLPPQRQEYTFVISTGDGHRAEYTLAADHEATAQSAPAAAPAATSAPADAARETMSPVTNQLLEELIARQIAPLREQLERAEEKVRLRDILGGIGYILGVFGIISYFKSRPRT